MSEQFAKRGMETDVRCQVCGEEPESVNHVLFNCDVARQVWALSRVPAPSGGFESSSLLANFQYLYQIHLDKRLELRTKRSFPWILWRLWKNRNKFFFENLCFSPQDSIVKIWEMWMSGLLHKRCLVSQRKWKVWVLSLRKICGYVPHINGSNVMWRCLGLTKTSWVEALGWLEVRVGRLLYIAEKCFVV